MSRAVREACSQVAGKEVLAMEAFANALEMIPTIIADNAGYDSADLVAGLKAAHATDAGISAGLDMDEGEVGCMEKLGITESYQVLIAIDHI